MYIFLIGLIVFAGMGLSIEAGIIGPLGQQVGHLWATFSIFAIGAILSYLLMLFFTPRQMISFTTRPAWELLAGILGPAYVVILTLATPIIGIALTMIGVLAGQIAQSIMIDHFGWFFTSKRPVDRYRIMAMLMMVLAILCLLGAAT
ncbi:DMT family transporter [Acinetobacter rudis]|uniref:DMT family transporter n=1 Tax=Acinetobacter rudis TaxID=632955 RepID=UPI00280CD941|nr:DMT family transporter [Acinetobacter rudis]MDQ8951883.1 DMT family transporter [Acinetobacter rudis]